MNEHVFSLQDGELTANVSGKPEHNSITVNFDIKDRGHAKPVIDMRKYENILAHYKTIRTTVEQISPSSIISELDLARGGYLEFSARFDTPKDYAAAMEAVRSLRLQPAIPPVRETGNDSSRESGLTQLERIQIEYESHPQDMPEVVPEIHRETSKTQSFSRRLIQVETAAELRRTLKVWKLDGETGGMNASVFPLDKSVISGKEADEATRLIAIRITPGVDTKEARLETYRNTNEIEKRLMHRSLPLISADVYLGTEPEGHSDTGVIIINAGKNPLETLERVNSTLAQVQEDYDVLRLKLGTRNRGADHYNRKVSPLPVRQPLDVVSAQLLSSMQDAMNNGLFSLNGTPDDLATWVRAAAAEIRKSQSQEPPRRASGY